MKKIISEMKIIKNECKSVKGIAVSRFKSTKKYTQLTSTEKDILKQLLADDHTEQCIVAFYITRQAHKSENIRTLAAQFGIKSNWANTVYEIGKKLMFKQINKIKHMKRDTPVRLEGVA
jgi:hypothetical protein